MEKISPTFYNRDLSWLSFNERVLLEASKESVPLLERIRFLSIYSSNLDEFYRVRIPALLALNKLVRKKRVQIPGAEVYTDLAAQVKTIIKKQQELFGSILRESILPALDLKGRRLVYDEPIPGIIGADAADYFFTHILAFLQVQKLSPDSDFFPENNKLYFMVVSQGTDGKESNLVMNIPSDNLPRFYTRQAEEIEYILFLDDIIKNNLQKVFSGVSLKAVFSFKVTRDAELGLDDEYEGDLAEKIEKQIEKRDRGLATRLLYDGRMPREYLDKLTAALHLEQASIIEGGTYHNLKDLSSFPLRDKVLSYPEWPAAGNSLTGSGLLLDQIAERDLIVHTPYQSYDTVLRFFNEASFDPGVEQIDVTVYRLASDSRIANALISAARNGKKVTVFVELKARFDEANNIRWSKKMKAAGIRIIYSVPSLKVHAKIALVRKRSGDEICHTGILATGNFNESTAAFYTDHILFTAHAGMLSEMKQLFQFLEQRKKPSGEDQLVFSNLLVARFNLTQEFLALIDNEISYCRSGLSAGITIKLNNLEEQVLITKLYEASSAGVKISIIVRGICCLIPGVPGMSANITVTRIIDRYLEHGRVFVFANNGDPKVYLGSADWMNRNIYRRIEVCFPIYDAKIREEILAIIELQLHDNVQAVKLDQQLANITIPQSDLPIRSQYAIWQLLRSKSVKAEQLL